MPVIRDILFGFRSAAARAALIAGESISPRFATESIRVVRPDAPYRPGD